MKSPRLTGNTLSRLRAATSTWPLNRAVKAQAFHSHAIDAVRSLPLEAREHFDEVPVPIAGAKPRAWHDAQLPAPTSRGHRWSSRELVAAFQGGGITPTQVLDSIRQQVTRSSWGESLFSPFVSFDWMRAEHDADESTARYQAGAALGPLDGVPLVIKDHHNIIGLPTWGGSGWLADPATVDSEVVQRMRKAGGIVYGKTHTTEWGMQPTGYNPNWDMPHNPYNRNFAAGGSSTGTGVALALGYASAGIGSDGGGSIRIPAAVNGIFGIKPTYQRLSREGDIWRHSTVGHNGPMAQSTYDLVELLLATGVGRDDNDPVTWFAPTDESPATTWRAALGRGVKGCRIGIWRKGWAQADPAIAALCMDALRRLEADGAQLIELDIDLAEYAPSLGVVMIGVETMGCLTDVMDHRADVSGEDLRFIMQILEQISARDFMIAQRTRGGIRRGLARAMAQVDVLALPTMNLIAPAYKPEENRVAILDDHAIGEMTRFAFLANLTGLPAGSVPVGQLNGLPVGMQFMGDAWDEASVFAVMAHAERTGISDQPVPAAFFSPLS